MNYSPDRFSKLCRDICARNEDEHHHKEDEDEDHTHTRENEKKENTRAMIARETKENENSTEEKPT